MHMNPCTHILFVHWYIYLLAGVWGGGCSISSITKTHVLAFVPKDFSAIELCDLFYVLNKLYSQKILRHWESSIPWGQCSPSIFFNSWELERMESRVPLIDPSLCSPCPGTEVLQQSFNASSNTDPNSLWGLCEGFNRRTPTHKSGDPTTENKKLIFFNWKRLSLSYRKH